MKLHHLTAIGLAALLAACGQKTEDETAANAGASAGMSGEMRNMGNMGNMDMPADMPMKMAKGTGTVTAIDKPEGSITIDHAPIPEANWPAMTMAFKARPELLGGVKVGDKVAFDLVFKDGAGEVTAITK
jgi:Cu(I)/Ag(I) efflux system protein CusF